MKKYWVTLPIEVDGMIYNYGDTVEMNLEDAAVYAHALIAVEEK